jgi:hypothetical protein
LGITNNTLFEFHFDNFILIIQGFLAITRIDAKCDVMGMGMFHLLLEMK